MYAHRLILLPKSNHKFTVYVQIRSVLTTAHAYGSRPQNTNDK